MDQNFLENERGVSVVLGAILVLMILVLILPIFYQSYVRTNMSEQEKNHMETVKDQFLNLQSKVSWMNNPQEGGKLEIPMSAGSVSLFPGQSPAGTLKMVPGEEMIQKSTGTGKEITITPGTIKFNGNNLYYPDQTYIYQAGHVLMEQGSSQILLSSNNNFISTENSITINNIEVDQNQSTASTGTKSLSLEWGGSNRIPKNKKWENTTELTLKINTEYKKAWKDYLNQMKGTITDAQTEIVNKTNQIGIKMKNDTGIKFQVRNLQIDSDNNVNTPMVTTFPVSNENTWSDAAILNMSYDFKDYTKGEVQFRYRKQGESWSVTSSETQYGNGNYSRLIKDLEANQDYICQAQLKHGSNTIQGEPKHFKTTGDPYSGTPEGINPGTGLGAVSEYKISDQSETMSVPNGKWEGITKTDQIILSNTETRLTDETWLDAFEIGDPKQSMLIEFTLDNGTHRYRINVELRKEDDEDETPEISIYSVENDTTRYGYLKESIENNLLNDPELYNGTDILNRRNYDNNPDIGLFGWGTYDWEKYRSYLKEIANMDSNEVTYLTQEIEGRVKVTLRGEALFTSLEPIPDNSLYQTEFVKIFFESPTDLSDWEIKNNEQSLQLPSVNYQGELYLVSNKQKFTNWRPEINDEKIVSFNDLQLVGGSFFFNNTGDKLELYDSNGELRDEIAYGSKSTSNNLSLDNRFKTIYNRTKYEDGIYKDTDHESDWSYRDGKQVLITGVYPDPKYSPYQTEFVKVFIEDESDLTDWKLEDSAGENILPSEGHKGDIYLVKDYDKFQTLYPNVDDSQINEKDSLNLDEDGDNLKLYDNYNKLRDEVAYGDQTTSNDWNKEIDGKEILYRQKFIEGELKKAYKDTNTKQDWSTKRKGIALITGIKPNLSTNKSLEHIQIFLENEINSTDTWKLKNNETTIKNISNPGLQGNIYITNNKTKFNSTYPDIENKKILENNSMNLNNTGELLKLQNSKNQVRDQVAYGNKTTTNNWNIKIKSNETAAREKTNQGTYIDTNKKSDWITGKINYNNDSIARDGPDKNYVPGGIEFSTTNNFTKEITITSLTINPKNQTINELDDTISQKEKGKSEIYIEPENNDDIVYDYESEKNTPALPIENSTTVTYGQNVEGGSNTRPIIQTKNKAYFYLYEFKHGQNYQNNLNTNITNKKISIKITYKINGVLGTNQFTLNPKKYTEEKLEFVEGSQEAKFDGKGSLKFELSNNKKTAHTKQKTHTIEKIRVNIENDKAEGIHEKKSREVEINNGGQDGYLEIKGDSYELGSLKTLDQFAKVYPNDKATIELRYFGYWHKQNNFKETNVDGDPILFEVIYGDGSSETFQFTG